MLGKSVDVIQQVVHKGILTPYPRDGKYRYVSRIQVMLFAGKKLSLHSLSEQEHRTWQGKKEALEQAHTIDRLTNEIKERLIDHFSELYTQKETGIVFPSSQGIDTYAFTVNALVVMDEDTLYKTVSTIINERIGDFISIVALCIIKQGVMWVIKNFLLEKAEIDEAMKKIQESELPFNVIDIIEARVAKEREIVA